MDKGWLKIKHKSFHEIKKNHNCDLQWLLLLNFIFWKKVIQEKRWFLNIKITFFDFNDLWGHSLFKKYLHFSSVSPMEKYKNSLSNRDFLCFFVSIRRTYVLNNPLDELFRYSFGSNWLSAWSYLSSDS